MIYYKQVRKMKKSILLFLAIFLISCTKKENYLSKQIQEYQSIVSKIKNEKIVKDKNFTIKAYYTKIDSIYRYDVFITKPLIEMKNIKLCIYAKNSLEKYYPTLGVFDKQSYSLKPHYVYKEKGYYKGIQLSGRTKMKENLKCFVQYTSNKQRKTSIIEVEV